MISGHHLVKFKHQPCEGCWLGLEQGATLAGDCSHKTRLKERSETSSSDLWVVIIQSATAEYLDLRMLWLIGMVQEDGRTFQVW